MPKFILHVHQALLSVTSGQVKPIFVHWKLQEKLNEKIRGLQVRVALQKLNLWMEKQYF